MKDETTSEGWNENYSSPDPEHARRQTTTSESTARFRKLICENPDQSCKDGFPPETGPDPRQPEMVSKQRVLEILQNHKLSCKRLACRAYEKGDRGQVASFDAMASRIEGIILQVEGL